MKLQLVIAPAPEEYLKIPRYACFPPLDLLSLASYVKIKMPQVEVEILDGQILGTGNILNLLSADFVGISPRISNYQESLEIARKAKETGATVVMGGAYATQMAKQILLARSEVDFIVAGDGEHALAALLRETEPAVIPNLHWRGEAGSIHLNRIEYLPLDSLPLVDNSLVDLTLYQENFAMAYLHLGNGPAICTCSQKGCKWRAKNGGCIFCGRMHPGWRARPPKAVWAEIQCAVKNLGVDFVWDVSDAFTSDKSWLREFASAKPPGINPGLMIQARADELDEETVDLLADTNCKRVLVGVESGDEQLLTACGKGTTPLQNLGAASGLARRGIEMFPSFVIGLPGETHSTLESTYRHAQQLLEFGLIAEIQALPFMPITGSSALAQIGAPATDALDLDALKREWIKNRTAVSYQEVMETADKIKALSRPKGTSYENIYK